MRRQGTMRHDCKDRIVKPRVDALRGHTSPPVVGGVVCTAADQ